jgi:hypothetical protein
VRNGDCAIGFLLAAMGLETSHNIRLTIVRLMRQIEKPIGREGPSEARGEEKRLSYLKIRLENNVSFFKKYHE